MEAATAPPAIASSLSSGLQFFLLLVMFSLLQQRCLATAFRGCSSQAVSLSCKFEGTFCASILESSLVQGLHSR